MTIRFDVKDIYDATPDEIAEWHLEHKLRAHFIQREQRKTREESYRIAYKAMLKRYGGAMCNAAKFAAADAL